ncbi:MAG: exodeoxyribonuclease VII small subunit [Oscillospiraceae bacterium]
MDFEKEIQKLRAISQKMGDGGITLEESMALYTEAVTLSKKLSDYIENAKLKVEQLEGN